MPEQDARAALDQAREAWAKQHMQLEIDLEPDPEPELDFPAIGTCGLCGAYWDTRYYETCPPPCGGYVG
jgi:hypothetical protein